MYGHVVKERQRRVGGVPIVLRCLSDVLTSIERLGNVVVGRWKPWDVTYEFQAF